MASERGESRSIPFLPPEVVAKIFLRASPSALATARFVCRSWKVEAERVLRSLTEDDWARACLRDIPHPTLYQLIYDLGLTKCSPFEAFDGHGNGGYGPPALEAVHWRMLYPTSFLRSVPFFATRDDLAAADVPVKMFFHGERAYKAWHSAGRVRRSDTRYLLERRIESFLLPPCYSAATCLRVTGDVVVLGLGSGGVVVVDLETGIDLSEVPGDLDRGAVTDVHLVSIGSVPDLRCVDGRYKLVGCSARACHDVALCSTRSGVVLLVLLTSGDPVVRGGGGGDLRANIALRHCEVGPRFQSVGPLAYAGHVPSGPGPSFADVCCFFAVGKMGAFFFNASPVDGLGLVSEVRTVSFPGDGQSDSPSPAEFQIFRKDAVALRNRNRRGGGNGGLALSSNGRKFVHHAGGSHPMHVTAVHVLGDVLAWGTRSGLVGVHFLDKSSQSLSELDLRFPDDEFDVFAEDEAAAADDDDDDERGENRRIRDLRVTYSRTGPELVCVTRNRMFRVTWPPIADDRN